MSGLVWLTDEQMVRVDPYFFKSHSKPLFGYRRVLSGDTVFFNRSGLRWYNEPKDDAPHKAPSISPKPVRRRD